MTKSIFNEGAVRPKFRSHFCRELTLPSGKMSGYCLFPITTEEVVELTQDLKAEDKPKGFFTASEWALWTALRRKYGVTHMNPKTKQERFIENPYNFLEPKEEGSAIDALEDKLLTYCDCRLNEILEIVQEKAPTPEPQRVSEGDKNFRASLDNNEIDVLY